MSEMTRHGIVLDLRLSAKVMADTDTFPTGQAILLDAANEIERLRDELVKLHCEQLYIAGFNNGWDAAVENGDAAILADPDTTEKG